MKHWKGIAIVGATVLGISSLALRDHGQQPQAIAPTEESPSPVVEQPLDPRTEHYYQLLEVMQDYDTQRVNNILITAQRLAAEQGKQPLDLIREWMHGHAQAYAESPNQESLMGYLYAFLAESVILKGQPMRMVSIDEPAVICSMRGVVYFDVPKEVQCNGR